MKWLMALAIAGTCSFAQPAEVRRWADHWAGEYGVERELVYAVIEACSESETDSTLKTMCELALPIWHGCGICAVETGA
jgi:hypothetical protein